MNATEILTLGPRVADFFETYLVHPKGDQWGERFVLERWQRDFIDEFYRVDEAGDRIYRQAILGIPRGNGKSPLAAGIGLWELVSRKDAPEVYNIAGSGDQAEEVTKFAKSFVDGVGHGKSKRGGGLGRWLKASSLAVTHTRSQGVMRLLKSSGAIQHGKSVSAAIVDEIHAITTADQIETVTALTTALHKRRNAFMLGITTAGSDKATLLGRMYEEALVELELELRLHVEGIGPCLTIGRDEANGILFWWYGPPERKENGEVLDVEEAVANDELLAAVNPAEWLSNDLIRMNLALLGGDEYDFARLHLDMWTPARTAFIHPAFWKTCYSRVKPVPKRPLFVAVDIGITHDTTAVGYSQPVEVEGKPRVVNRARVWSANPAHEKDRTTRHVWVPDGRVDLELVEEFILGLVRGFQVMEVVYDPTFFEGEAQRLAKKGIRVAPVHQNGVLPQIAYQRFFQDVKEGTALHGNDAVLSRHVLAAAGVKTERGWRVSELRSSEPIDALQAVSMSNWRASRQSGSVYEEREMRSVGGDDEDDDEEN